MKISINAGHSPAAPGASGYLDEVKEARKVRDALKKELKARGHTVYDSTAADTTIDTVSEQVRKVNAKNVDLAMSIHFNAGGGTGTECFYYRGDRLGKSLASEVSAACAKALGIRDRGAKPDTASNVGSLGFICYTNPLAVLLEVCFVDTKTDYNAYKKTGPSAIAYAVANAIVGDTAGKPAASAKTGLYCVTVDADDVLNIRAGAGTNYKITGSVKRGEAFTITQVKAGTGSEKGWGKLKSGAGWLSLDFMERV